MCGWAIEQGLCESNAVVGTGKAKEGGPRARVLSDAEIAAIWKAAPDNSYGKIVKLLTLTAQRRDEIGSLGWSEIDTDEAVIALPAERTKNGRPHSLPLSASALAILKAAPQVVGRNLVFGEGRGGFSGWSKAKAALDEACGVKDWTLHDLRRTAASGMARLGISLPVIEKVLNHVSGSFAGIVGVYQRHEFSEEKRAALNTWAAHIEAIVAGKAGSNIVTMKRA
jgi:integrase